MLSRAAPLKASVSLLRRLPLGGVGGISTITLTNQRREASSSSSSSAAGTSSLPTSSFNAQRFSLCSGIVPYHIGREEGRWLSTSAATINTDVLDEDDSDDDQVAGKRQTHWNKMFEDLQQYREINGDTLVPARCPENPSLGHWVDAQRQSYRIRKELENEPDLNKHPEYYRYGNMSDERIEKLNSIDFCWSLFDKNWNEKYEALKAFVAEHGNALVPVNQKIEPLSVWAHTQRSFMRKRNDAKDPNKKESFLSSERIDKLNEVDFVWEVHEAQWFERLEELKLYRQNHGSSHVPKREGGLGRWVDKQREDYRRYMAIKKIREEWGNIEDDIIPDEEVMTELERLKSRSTGMNQTRIELLEAEDMIWDPLQYAWDLKFGELCDFVALNGHAALFRRKGQKYIPLYRWAEAQRANYKKYVRGEKSALTEGRIARLNSLNFVWEAAKATSEMNSANINKRIIMPKKMQQNGEV